jgi:hypothetical protein
MKMTVLIQDGVVAGLAPGTTAGEHAIAAAAPGKGAKPAGGLVSSARQQLLEVDVAEKLGPDATPDQLWRATAQIDPGIAPASRQGGLVE